jgi:hypothetical protein
LPIEELEEGEPWENDPWGYLEEFGEWHGPVMGSPPSDPLAEALEGLGEWIAGLFGGEDDPPTSTDPEPAPPESTDPPAPEDGATEPDPLEGAEPEGDNPFKEDDLPEDNSKAQSSPSGGTTPQSTSGNAIPSIGPKAARDMAKRGWTDSDFERAIANGPVGYHVNLPNGNEALRYDDPVTGRSVIVDTVANEVIQFGGKGFLWEPKSGYVGPVPPYKW